MGFLLKTSVDFLRIALPSMCTSQILCPKAIVDSLTTARIYMLSIGVCETVEGIFICSALTASIQGFKNP